MGGDILGTAAGCQYDYSRYYRSKPSRYLFSIAHFLHDAFKLDSYQPG